MGVLQMASDSTQAGYLTEQSTDAVYGDDLDRLLSRWFKGVSGYPDGMVRARWQQTQAPLLSSLTDWCAFGVTGIRGDYSVAMSAVDSESDDLFRHESIDCLASFYGPAGMSMATAFRDGASVEQSNETLKASGMTLQQIGDAINFPELINNQWVRRYDVAITVRRKVTRNYAIRSIKSAETKFFGD
ncbi:hypothetical protein JK211_07910 [Tatumella sp. JGM130]|uniref:phage neck terminator protein n=1 Tax=Tatumella sp. JGM130 TaxID=2799797 RepID=UPI001BB07E44|nr:hypothetical protein [Tatumella sp. JGM130]MBS0893958.1 hypothetical protein [Tatumella sp. JGM130]